MTPDRLRASTIAKIVEEAAHAAAHPDRPLRLEWIKAGSLTPNPANWRKHPKNQTRAIKAVLNDPEIGWAGACLYNEKTGHLIDGHARTNAVDPNTPIPVLVGSWSEEAEKKILATHDPLGEMAGADPEKLGELMSDVKLDGQDYAGLCDQLAGLMDSGILDDDLAHFEGFTKETEDPPVTPEGKLKAPTSNQLSIVITGERGDIMSLRSRIAAERSRGNHETMAQALLALVKKRDTEDAGEQYERDFATVPDTVPDAYGDDELPTA